MMYAHLYVGGDMDGLFYLSAVVCMYVWMYVCIIVRKLVWHVQ